MNDTSSPPTTKDKEIVITGQHNKYMLNKVLKKKKEVINRKNANNINPEYYDHTFQLNNISTCQTIVSSIKGKLVSYKNQDILKKRLDKEQFVSYDYICDQLTTCNTSCHYCKTLVFILYKQQRDMQQWTLDRIDNDIGHNIGNIVISCLACNLQRKTRNADKFLTTKQLVIKRIGNEDEHNDNKL